ncbi:porin family protein [Sphingobacterium griseoflavum]|uniref:Collagen-binding protein n=1 Tax=Sphingobacterium griseoflavum TaxID=1474952 RepID=A0ABQ3HWX6_9SPHI|nr:hypothetical protein [Sphingobacterium griseoflavum]GHE34214.1 collagen-binding protein [Sphingobacterium griseoflavum]
MKIDKSILFVIFILFSTHAIAQNKNTTVKGIVKGIIRDSVYNHVMKSTTVSIYADRDSLLSYQMSNNLGAFYFNELPVGKNLKLIISNVGYDEISKSFIIDKDSKAIDFKVIYVSQKMNQIDEVLVTVPPIRMNGDTLEFNASAFHLDSNAVVQDLMKKIPNITQWGDGKITVNGREIKSLLVNGREFMGSDSRIAIENIPKNALEKIQVYNVADNPKNRQDSILHMNLKLKKGKDNGYFGKMGGSLGTGSRYEGDLSFNVFSPKLQISIVGASNNVNKIPNDINTLLRNSTFKGVGVQLDYMTDFRKAGLTQPNSGGYAFTYDFRDLTEKKQYRNVLSSEYFLLNNHILQGEESQTETSLNNQSGILEQNIRNSQADDIAHRFNNSYQFAKDRYSFNFSQSLHVNNSSSTRSNSSLSANENNQIVSQSSNVNKNDEKGKSFDFKSGASFFSNIWDIDRRFTSFDLNYALRINDKRNDRETYTDFISHVDSKQNKSFNRTYNNNAQHIAHSLSFNIPSMVKLLFGVRKFGLFEVDIKNNLDIVNNRERDMVFDYNSQLTRLTENTYLTNNSSYNTLTYEPILSLNRTITKALTNRFYKALSFAVNIKQQFFKQHNTSAKEIQNIDRLYTNFIPAASISFSDSQFGDYRKTISFHYDNKIGVPQIWQMAPLIDSANVYFLRMTNLDLKEKRTESISFNFKRSNDKKDDFEYSLGLRYSTVHNNIIDSILIDNQNVRTIYMINNSDNRTINAIGGLNKAIKLKNSEVQLSYNSEFNNVLSPHVINNSSDIWTTNYFNNSFDINYTYNSQLAIEGKQQFRNSFTKQVSKTENSFKNSNISTSISVSCNVTKKFRINSNIEFSTLKSTGSASINYNIWNASALYRLLKGDNLELKLSALDILHQNTAIINRNAGGVITFGTQQVLQQYFTFGVSYYPRKFGKRNRI